MSKRLGTVAHLNGLLTDLALVGALVLLEELKRLRLCRVAGVGLVEERLDALQNLRCAEERGAVSELPERSNSKERGGLTVRKLCEAFQPFSSSSMERQTVPEG